MSTVFIWEYFMYIFVCVDIYLVPYYLGVSIPISITIYIIP